MDGVTVRDLGIVFTLNSLAEGKDRLFCPKRAHNLTNKHLMVI
jgi:hypothetical protein